MTLAEVKHIQRVVIMSLWIKRRAVRGLAPAADVVWERIKFNWPSLSDAEAKQILHEVKQ